MVDENKYYTTHIGIALGKLTDVPHNIEGEIETEADWNTNVKFRTGIDENNVNIWSTDKPEGITYAAVKAKQDELVAEYDALDYARARAVAYPSLSDFMEAYTEKEIGDDSTKWDAYVINYNKVRTENPK